MAGKKTKFILVLLLFFGLLGSGRAQNSRVSLSLKAGYGMPYSSTFNKEYVPAVNTELKDMAEFLKDFGLNSSYLKIHKLRGLILFGTELEIKATQQFWLVIGSEFWLKTLNTALDASGTVDNVNYNIQDQGEIKFYVLPVLATVRINLPFEMARIYIGGGGGYYFSWLRMEHQWNWMSGSDYIDFNSRKVIATGRALLPHANIGGEVKLTENISFNLDIRYVFGNIKTFKVKKDTLDANNVGQNLIFTDSQGGTKEFRWEMSGPVIGAQLKFKF